MMHGLGRVLRNEEPSLLLVTIDLDVLESRVNWSREAECVANLEIKLQNASNRNCIDFEYLLHNEVLQLQVSRVVPDRKLNSQFTDMLNGTPEMLEYEPTRDLQLAVGSFGDMDSVYFQESLRNKLPLHEDEVEIAIKACGVNFKVSYAIPSL
jgi:hypothetical protein